MLLYALIEEGTAERKPPQKSLLSLKKVNYNGDLNAGPQFYQQINLKILKKYLKI